MVTSTAVIIDFVGLISGRHSVNSPAMTSSSTFPTDGRAHASDTLPLNGSAPRLNYNVVHPFSSTSSSARPISDELNTNSRHPEAHEAMTEHDELNSINSRLVGEMHGGGGSLPAWTVTAQGSV